MDDFSIWWYLIAAVIYFLTRGKKKKSQEKPQPGAENTPTQTRPKSFEELLKEITEGRVSDEPKQTPVEIERKPEETKPESPSRLEGERRAFADEESRKVYEESIKMAEGSDIAFQRDEHFRSPSLFKEDREEEKERSYAEELMDGFDTDEAKKAVIYSEILARKY